MEEEEDRTSSSNAFPILMDEFWRQTAFYTKFTLTVELNIEDFPITTLFVTNSGVGEHPSLNWHFCHLWKSVDILWNIVSGAWPDLIVWEKISIIELARKESGSFFMEKIMRIKVRFSLFFIGPIFTVWIFRIRHDILFLSISNWHLNQNDNI